MIPFYFARRRRRVFTAPRRFQQLRRTVSSFLALAAGVAFLHALAMMAFEGSLVSPGDLADRDDNCDRGLW